MFVSTLSFVLLSPVAGAIAGALGIIGVATLYFLKLRRRPMRVGSTMLWEQAVRDLQVNAPFRMIHPSRLLLLQLLAVLLLAFAVARPAIDRPDAADRLVILLDTSASMQAPVGVAGDGVTRFDVVREQLDEVLSRVGSETRIALLSFNHEARTEVPFTLDAGAVRSVLRSLEPTDGPSDLSAGLSLVEAITASAVSLDESLNGAPSTRLLIASDGDVRFTSGSDTRLVNTSINYVAAAEVGAEVVENVAIVNASATRDASDSSRVRVFVEVLRNRGVNAEVRLSATMNGDVVAAETVRLLPEGDTAVGSASFEVASEALSIIRVQLSGSDALEADNAASIVLEPYRSVSVDLVTPTGVLSTSGEAALYDALTAVGISDVRVTTAGGVRTDAADAGAVLLHVYSGVEPVVSSVVPEIVFAAGESAVGIEARPAEGDGARGFAFWRRNHPLLRYAGLSEVAFAGGVTYLFDESTGSESGVRFTPIASSDAGSVIGLHERGVKRRLLVGIDLGRTTWWRSPSWIIFMQNAVDSLTQRADRIAGRARAVGEAFTANTGVAGGTYRVERDGEVVGEVRSSSDGTVTVGAQPSSGLYEIRSVADGSLASVVGVSVLDRDESSLGVSESIPVGGENVSASGASQLAPAEIWKWFVLGAFGLMSVEWLLYVRGVRPS